ncbi:MAG: xanthine dehydrogenase family protein subunit M [Pseudomonadota bacterium]|nr:xanthine dehydrogenase family protein subunit M [Pseudomonadota bacterium]
MNNFSYQRPTTLDEAFSIKNEAPENSRFVAGGSDIFLLLKKNIIAPDQLISLRAISELKGIEKIENRITIGSGTTICEIEKSELIQKHCPALHDAVRDMASVQIRNVATLGGNIVNASPGADTAAPLLIYDAKVIVINSQPSEKIVPLSNFFKGPKQVHLEKNELVKGFILEIPAAGSGSAYLKFMKRKAMDLANVGVAVNINFSKENLCQDIKIALATVAPTPLRAVKTEAFLLGKELDQENLVKSGEIAATEIAPINDLRGKAWHKIEVAKTYIKRACLLANERSNLD